MSKDSPHNGQQRELLLRSEWVEEVVGEERPNDDGRCCCPSFSRPADSFSLLISLPMSILIPLLMSTPSFSFVVVVGEDEGDLLC